MTIYYVMYEAMPNADSEDFANCGGAYVNCWVRADSEGEAERMASAAIREREWSITSVEDQCREVTDQSYTKDDEEWEYYREAVAEGECYVYHEWPVEPQEQDQVH
jgi:hypothetical protein